ncbi:hypothetical protein [Dysgonomonas reticulitermitis]
MKKLNLKDANLMTDSEMKMIVGGYEIVGGGYTTAASRCVGKDLCAECVARVNSIGQDVMGKCSQNSFNDGQRYCSELNCHY